MRNLVYLLILFTLPVQAQVVPFVPHAAGGAVAISETWGSDTIGTLWTETVTDFAHNAGGFVEHVTSPAQIVYSDESLSGTAGFCTAQVVTTIDSNNSYSGFVFRHNGSDAVDRNYIVRYQDTDDMFVWRHCAGASCTDIETGGAVTLVVNDYWGVEFEGTGTSTVVRSYDCSTTDCAGTAPGTCGCTLIDTFTNDPPTGTYPELDTNFYVGWYSGHTDDETGMDNFGCGDN